MSGFGNIGNNSSRFTKKKSGGRGKGKGQRARREAQRVRNIRAVEEWNNGDRLAIFNAAAQYHFEHNMARIANGDYYLVD